jgi:hypothetical protein
LGRSAGFRSGLLLAVSAFGRASLDDLGDPVLIEIEPVAANQLTLSLDIAEIVRERIAMRNKYGSAFAETDKPEVRELSKWALFHGLTESIKTVYQEEIGEFLLDRWSTPSIEQWAQYEELLKVGPLTVFVNQSGMRA